MQTQHQLTRPLHFPRWLVDWLLIVVVVIAAATVTTLWPVPPTDTVALEVVAPAAPEASPAYEEPSVPKTASVHFPDNEPTEEIATF